MKQSEHLKEAVPLSLPRWAAIASEQRYWLFALLLYAYAMRHLQGIDPARPEKVHVLMHAIVSGVGLFGLAALGSVRRRSLPERVVMALLWAVTIGFLYTACRKIVISHIVDFDLQLWMRRLVYLATALGLGALPAYWFGRRRLCIGLLGGAIAALLVARGFVLNISPTPSIDVFTLAQEASAALQRGENPYAADYSNFYAGTILDLGYSPGYNYFPVMLVANTLGDLLFHDVRALFVLMEALSAFFIFRLVRALGWTLPVSLTAALLWSANALSFQTVEKWNDSLVLAAVLGCVALLSERRWLAAGIALGLAAASKQYAPLAFVPIGLWLWKAGPPRSLRRFAIGAGVTLAVAFLPFLLNQGDWLLARTLLHFAGTPFREDSLSLLNVLRSVLGLGPKSLLIRVSPFLGLVLGLGLSSWLVLRCRPAPDDDPAQRADNLHKLIAALVFIWAGFFHFIKQSFLNYDYFAFGVAVLLLFTMVQAPKAPIRSSS